MPPPDLVFDALMQARTALSTIEENSTALRASALEMQTAEARWQEALAKLRATAEQVAQQVGTKMQVLQGTLQEHVKALADLPDAKVAADTAALQTRAIGLGRGLAALAGAASGMKNALDRALETAGERIEELPERAGEAIGASLESFLDVPGELAEELEERVEATLSTAEELVADRVESSFGRVEEVLGEIVANEIQEAITTAIGSTSLSQALQPYLPQMIVVQRGLPVLKKMLSGGL